MEENQNVPALIPAETIAQIMQSAPQTLEMNSETVKRSLAVGESLLEAAAREMTPELDEAIRKYIAKNRAAVETCYNRRSPITQEFTKIQKIFTSLENQISPKEPTSIPAKLQAVIDTYAAKLLKEQRERDEENKRKLEYENARINAKAECKIAFANHINNYISNVESVLSSILIFLKLEEVNTLPTKVAEIHDTIPAIAISNFSYLNYKLTAADLADITMQVVTDGQAEAKALYQSRIAAAKYDLNVKLPGKIQELKATEEKMKAANSAAEKIRLEEEELAKQKARVEKENAEREKADLEAKQKAEAEAEAMKIKESATAMFDAHVENAGAENVKAKVTLDIRITTAAAFLPIISQYFQIEGMNKKPEELEKVTLGKMRAVCAKHANNGKERIESAGVEYFEAVKAK